MNYKHLSLLIVLVIVVASLFFFSSWTNAMVVSEDGVSQGMGVLTKVSPLLTGLLIVVVMAVLAAVVFDR